MEQRRRTAMKENDELGKLLNDKKTLSKLSQSGDAKALAGLLQQGRDQAELEKIAKDAAKGDTEQLRELVRSIAESPGGAALLERLEKTIQSK
jgi:ribonuclease D